MKRKTNNKKIVKTEPIAEDNVQVLVEDVKKIAKEDFGKFSAIVAVVFSCGLWIVKGVWYTYITGKFCVYKIDKCYINADNENIFLELIQLSSILVVWFLINYMYYKISIMKDETRFSLKKKIKKLGFWITEIILVFVWIMFSPNIEFFEKFGEVTLEKIVALLIVSSTFCLLINIYAIEFLIKDWWKKNKIKKANNLETHLKRQIRLKEMLFPAIVTIAIELIIVFYVSYFSELDRCAYKVIMIQSEEDKMSEYIVEYGKNGNRYEIYPIAYENEKSYIITRLVNNNGKITIDYDYQRIVDKEGQEVIYIQNIYEIQ